jgi:SAM-dependent methyltransferase
MEYPIIDGIPIFVPHIRTYVAENLVQITTRNDLSEATESLLGDAAGPGTVFDAARQHVSTYAWDHYGDLDPDEPVTDLAPGAAVRCLEKGLGLLNREVTGPVIDLGCSVGRTTFVLAEQCQGLVLGVDINFSMLLVAQRVLQSREVRYSRRRVGIVYDRREFKVHLENADRVDFWVCDVITLPFSNGTFDLAVGLNVLDCVPSPYDFLRSLKGSYTQPDPPSSLHPTIGPQGQHLLKLGSAGILNGVRVGEQANPY